MQLLPLRTLFVLLAYTHVLLSFGSHGDIRTKEDGNGSSHSARTFHWSSSRDSHQNKARERALFTSHATGATISKASANSTHPWIKVTAAEARKLARSNSRPDLNRTVTPGEDANAASHWDPTRQHNNKRIKLNGGLSGPAAGGHYNAPKPSSVVMGDEEGDRRKSVFSKEERQKKKAAPKRGKTRQNKSSMVSSQSHSVPWEPMPKPVALTSTDLPSDLFTRRNDFYTFRGEENPWDATPMTPPSSLDSVDEIKNPFYPVTSETYGAYAITCVSGVIFLVGIAGNIAILCIVCQNYYMKSISNSLLANLAVWDFVLILFCLPMVVFHELTKSWLLGEFTCKVVPYVEVMPV